MNELSEFLCEINELSHLKTKAIYSTLYQKKVIVLLFDQQIYAWLDACPHYVQATPMSWKSDHYLSEDKKFIQCFAHGALFDFQTGHCIKGPCIGQKLTEVKIAIVNNQLFCLRKI